MYCKIISKLTKVVQSKEIKKNFFKFNTLLNKRISMTKIKIKNLTSIKDLKIGLISNDQFLADSFNNPGLRNCIVVDKKKYKKKEIRSQ